MFPVSLLSANASLKSSKKEQILIGGYMSGFQEQEVIYIGVDIGGSHVGACAISKSYNLISSCELENTLEEVADSDVMKEKIFKMIDDVKSMAEEKLGKKVFLAAIGLGCPGQSKDGVLVAAANFPQWKNVPFVDYISAKYNLPAVLLNDVDAALAAEYWGQPDKYSNVKHVVMIALGTGVGYAVVVNGKQLFGHFGLLEGGHMIINPHSDLLCGCGQYGCIEAYASAKNTALRYRNAYYAINNCEECDRLEFNAKEVFDRAKNGDEIACKIIDEVADYLAVFSINISRMLDPEVVIFAGGMAQAGEFLLSRIQHHFSRRTWTVLPSEVSLKLASNCDSVGMIGAAIAASQSG